MARRLSDFWKRFQAGLGAEVEENHCKNREKILFAVKYLAVLHLPFRYFHLRTAFSLRTVILAPYSGVAFYLRVGLRRRNDMKVTSDMTINAVLAMGEEKMLHTLAWLIPELGRLQSPSPRRATIGSVSVKQAARIARIPLTEMLYALNLAAGEKEEDLSEELCSGNCRDFDYHETNPRVKAKRSLL